MCDDVIDSDNEVVGEYDLHDTERWASEPHHTRARTPFERDRARIIHSSALRRLGAKSQVLVAGSDDFARTRLTHTLEVAQIGRQIASMLGADPDVVDCACLSHDLGHPPFGHNGERALAKIASNIGGFEGNAQTLRLLTRLEPKVFRENGASAGVNLTRAALDAAVKYPWGLDEAKAHDKGERDLKFCVYPDDREVFNWLKTGSPRESKPIECQIMDLSDDIAYSVHDIEDAIVTGAFNPELVSDSNVADQVIQEAHNWYGTQWDADNLLAAFKRLRARNMFPDSFDGSRRSLAHLKNITSALIGRFASSVERATREKYGNGALIRYRANIVIPPETSYEIIVLKSLAVHFIIQPREREFYRREQKILTDLVEVFMSKSPRAHDAMESVFISDWNACSSEDERLRVAIDQVASLTDGSATALHAALC
ncbi:deoxyguanosinetriphosphate triphosphohydrolase [Gardnerella vaginalis]|uniref:Putative dGTPase n=1 Tax=Gardnerella vaginalis TaxID=2702 RepID=A0A133NQ03_GARVA|nr:deoxyguanosinetriphosphate triphosphohydrolase [Gardnerella vaginalis]KXA18382.1 putative dGTPase [Gardnerella vaginalis]MDK7191902.1 deoxyguanosinetriphosphate triphosphohydrolase [Bifidobacterium sp. UMB1197]